MAVPTVGTTAVAADVPTGAVPRVLMQQGLLGPTALGAMRHGLTARIGHAQKAGAHGAKEDHTVRAPCALAKPPGVLAQGLRWTTRYRHLLQPSWKPVHAKREELPVRRPEGTGYGAFGSRQRPSVEHVERPYPE